MWICLVFFALIASISFAAPTSPHIIYILADDLGAADLGYSGASYPTPNIDGLSKEGVTLTTHYSHNVCTPSRAAFLTGRYASNAGLPMPLLGGSPFGLEKDHTTIAEELKARGYDTAMFGKWHVGNGKWAYTPTHRGFDRFVGSLLAATGFYSKKLPPAVDFRNQEEPYFNETHYTALVADEAVRYITEHSSNPETRDAPMFIYLAFTAPHTPLEPDEESLAACGHITHPLRYLYCGLVNGLDTAVGQVVSSLRDAGVYEDTLVIFASDNGAFPFGGGNNYPFRGQKHGSFEGGVRTPAVIAGGYTSSRLTELDRVGTSWDGLMHICDWYSSLLKLVDDHRIGKEAAYESHVAPIATRTFGSDLDSIPMFDEIFEGGPSPREEALVVFDPFIQSFALRVGKFKLIRGRPGDNHVFNIPDDAGQWIVPAEDATWTDRTCEWLVLQVVKRMKDASILMVDLIREAMIYINDYTHGTKFSANLAPLEENGPAPDAVFLYNVDADPSESTNLAFDPEYKTVLDTLQERLNFIGENTPRLKNGDIFDTRRTLPKGLDPTHPDVLFHTPWMDDSEDPWKIADEYGVSFVNRLFSNLIKVAVFGVVLVVAGILLLRSFLKMRNSQLRRDNERAEKKKR